MKKVLLMIFCFVFIVSLSGCGTRKLDDGVKVIRVSFWGSPEEVEIIKGIINKWELTNPQIKVKLDHINYGGYSSKILTQIAGGAAPDIICTEVDMFVNFVKKGVLYPLDEFIQQDEVFNQTCAEFPASSAAGMNEQHKKETIPVKIPWNSAQGRFNVSDFFPEVVDRFTVEDQLYCLPRDTAPFACVYYNKTLFDKNNIEYPDNAWDWDSLLEKAKQLTIVGDDGRIKQYGFYTWAWQNFIYSNGGSLVDDVRNPVKCLLDMENSIQGLQYYTDLINKHKVMPTPMGMSNLGMGVHSMFVAGKLAMFCSGIWETPILRKKSESLKGTGTEFDWDVVMFPKGPGGKRGFGTGGSGYCITKDSRNKKEAWEVIKALTGDEGQIKMAATGLIQPANKRIASSDYWAIDNKMPLNKIMLNKAVRYVTYNPFHAKWAEIQQLYITPKLELIFNNKIPVKEGVALFIDKVNKMLVFKD